MEQLYKRRLTNLRNYMDENQIEVAMISNRKNVYYYTGFDSEPYERFMAVVIDCRTEKNYLFVPALDMQEAEEHSVIDTIVPISDEQNPYHILKETMDNGQVFRSLGLEKKTVTMYQHQQLMKCFPSCKYINISEYLTAQRMRKSPEEIMKVQNAIHIVEQVLAQGIKKVKYGVTELELMSEFELLMRKLGADGPSFPTIVLSGVNSSLPHGSPGRKTVEYGDFLLIDMGVIVDGYCSDITRTFIVGEETVEQKKIYDTVLQSLKAGISVIKAGIPAAIVDITARNVIKEKGYEQYFNNRVGHGLGMDVHEEPSIHEKNLLPLDKGFLFTVEPGIYIPNFGGVRIEENVYIKEDGQAKVLTSYPTELIRIG